MKTSLTILKPRQRRCASSNNAGPKTYREAKIEFERNYLVELLVWARGNVKRASVRADRDRKGLYILMSKHGLNPLLFRERT